MSDDEAPPEVPPEEPPEPPVEAPPVQVPPSGPKEHVGLHNNVEFLLYLTLVFGLLFLFIPVIVRKGPNVGITRISLMMTLFCIWIFWATIYLSQMQPLVGPVLHNFTIAWIMHSWPYVKK